jgi:hypothetical protein
MNHNRWLSKTPHDSELLTQHSAPWVTTTGSAKLPMVYNHWLSIAHTGSQPLAHAAYLTVIHDNLLGIAHHDSQSLVENNTR